MRTHKPILESLAEQPGIGAIPVTDLSSRMERMGKVTLRRNGSFSSGFEHEFMYTMHVSELSAFLREAGPCSVGEAETNLYRNRYANVIPFDATRVALTSPSPISPPPLSGPLLPPLPDADAGAAADPSVGPCDVSSLPLGPEAESISSPSDFLNASFVSGQAPNAKHAYIASQAPLPWTAEAFWAAIWENNVRTIVMLTDLVESGIIKADRYWPPPRSQAAQEAADEAGLSAVGQGSLNLGPFWIACEGHRYDAPTGVDERSLIVSRMEEDGSVATRRVKQFHFRQWPDHGVPEDSHQLLALVRSLWARSDEEREEDPDSESAAPLLVHCSAGVGRTGVFIAVHSILSRFRYELAAGVPIHDLSVSIPLTVLGLRLQRRYCVQTPDQYQLCYIAVLEFLESELGLSVSGGTTADLVTESSSPSSPSSSTAAVQPESTLP